MIWYGLEEDAPEPGSWRIDDLSVYLEKIIGLKNYFG